MSKKAVAIAATAFVLIFIYKALRFMALQWYSDSATLVEAICHAPQRIGLTRVHFSYGCWIFTPICKLLPCVDFIFFLIAVSAFSMAAAGYVIYLITKDLTKSELAAIAMMLAFYLSPDLHGLIAFDIHALSFALPFLALAAYNLIKDRPKRGYLFGIIALSFKETIAFPLLGLFLWRLASRKLRIWEWAALIVLIAVAIIYYKFYYGMLHYRWDLENVKTLFIYPKLIFLFIHAAIYPLVTSVFALPEFLIVLPDTINILLTRYFMYKFQFGYHHYAPLALAAITASALVLGKYVRKDKVGRVAVASLLLLAVADLILSPITVITFLNFMAQLHDEHNDSILGFFRTIPPYPLNKNVAYRPVNIWNLECFNGALKLYNEFVRTHKPGIWMGTNDHLQALFSCKYYVINIGLPQMKPWDKLCSQGCFKEIWRFYYVMVCNKATALALLYGPRYTLPLPLWIAKLFGNVTVVKGAGIILDMPSNKTLRCQLGKEIVLNEIKKYQMYAIGKCCNKVFRVYKLYIPVKGRTIVRGQFYADLNGTYTFWASPAIEKVIIDGKTYRPTNQKRMMYDFMYGKYLTTLKLTQGWHNITVVSNKGFMAIYWKTPLSCAPHPIFGFHLRPPPSFGGR